MTENKKIIEQYLDGYRKSDHGQILSCLTEDVEWDMPGVFHLKGKAAFEKEIEKNSIYVGNPLVTISRMVEENDVVVAEGAVRVPKRDGDVLSAVFCDLFAMKDARIQRLTTYLTVVPS